MKFIVIILSVIFLVSGEGLYTQEQIATTQRFMQECKDGTGISQAKVDEMINRIFVEDEKSRNYMLCMYQKLQFIEQDGTINKDNLRKFFGHQLAGETLDKCINKTGSTTSQTAFLIAKCYMQSLPKNVIGWVN